MQAVPAWLAEGSGLYRYLLKVRTVIPLPPVSVRFRFLSSTFLFSPYTVPPLSTKNPVTSLPFPPLHLLCPVILSSISALPCIVRLSSSTVACHTLLVPSHFPHYNVRARVWVWKCCKFCKFASLPSVFFFFRFFRLFVCVFVFFFFRFCLRACEYYNVSVFFLPCPPL